MPANWFIALPVNAEGWFARRVPPVPAGLRRFTEDDLHVTVAFLGPVEPELAVAAYEAMTTPAPLDATLGAVVPMGGRPAYSALSALVTDGGEALEACITRLRGPALERAGRPAERRPARAHVTLARPRRRATEEQRRSGLQWAQKVDVQGVPLKLRRLALYTWSVDRSVRLFRIHRDRPLVSSEP